MFTLTVCVLQAFDDSVEGYSEIIAPSQIEQSI